MPFKIARGDITKVKADVIVNTANPNPICASGTDLAIYEAAGKEKLLALNYQILEKVRRRRTNLSQIQMFWLITCLFPIFEKLWY